MAFLQTFINVVMIVVLAVPGFVLRKCRLLPDKAASVFAVLLLYIAQPFLMMSSLLNKEFQPSMLVNFGWVILFAAGLQLLVYFSAKLFFAGNKDAASRRAAIACSYLGNVGFMGIPVMQMLYPGNDDMVLYTVVYNIVFNAMTWSLGVYVVTGEKKMINPLKIVLNPPTIAAIVALPFFFLNLHIPVQVMTPVSYLGDMTLPLSMIILGVRLADMPLIGARAEKTLLQQGTAISRTGAQKTELAEGGAQISAMADEDDQVSAIADETAQMSVLSEKEGPSAATSGEGVCPAPSSKARKGILDNVSVYLVAFIKLIVSPLLGLGVMLLVRLFVPIDRFVIIALFIIGAMPSASSALNFAEMFGGDKETAAASTLMNTVLCILTIPVLMLLCELI